MATYQTRSREPLLDHSVQALLERRARELFGLALIGVAAVFALMLLSYSPDDPGWMVASDQPIHNALGRFGAAVADTLITISGMGAWGIPVVTFAWGLRFASHRGADRALSRVVFAVIALALGSVYCATLVPDASWSHSYGLGGLFGDTILGSLINLLPGGAAIGLKIISLVMAAAFLAMMLFVTGFDLREILAIATFLLVGLVVAYSGAVALLRRGAIGSVHAAVALNDHRLERRATTRAQPLAAPRRSPHAAAPMTEADPAAWSRPTPLRADPRYPEPLAAEPAYAAPREKLSLLARLPQLMRREVEPELELFEPPLTQAAALAQAPSEDRIRNRISAAIRSRAADPSEGVARREPPVVARPLASRPLGPQPLIADTSPRAYQATPPLTATEEDDDLPDVLGTPLVAERAPLVQTPARKPAPSRQALAEAQPALRFDDRASAYELPPLSLLSNPISIQRHTLSHEALEENARMLESVLDDYGVKGEIISVRPGPVVTMYELEPAPGLKASRVIGLSDDIARSMSALSARVSTVPGRTVIGIELPNAVREKVVLREILSARDFGDSSMRLPLALGKDIGGEPIIANLAKMPHLLIAGTTGSGKSVAINTMILSLLYKLTPEECRLIMIDPKMLELSVYDGIPHLLSPVVTDPKKAVVALKWVVSEMEDRYRKMSKMGVRNIEGYNGRVREALAKNEMFKRTIQTGFDEDTGEPVFETEEFAPVTLPYIVVVVDEMADLMMVAGKEIEACIQRLAQMARASGIHLIMATQRPSVDVITGTIKANFPTRISFQVTSKIDSRTILGEQGAEQLLGMGDMLYMAGGGRVSRIHGPFVSDEEVEEIVTHLKSYGPPEYMSGVVEGPTDEDGDIDLVLGLGGEASDETLYDQAVAIVARDRKCSTSYIQRKLGIGYNKAARLVEQMEEQGVVTPANHVGKREILVEER
jgi:DNA segregation ATPase FtsK/SpoIIIE, S-DNA-T family